MWGGRAAGQRGGAEYRKDTTAVPTQELGGNMEETEPVDTSWETYLKTQEHTNQNRYDM